LVMVRDTGLHVAHEQRGHGERRSMSLRTAFTQASWHHSVLRACSQAGFVNNLNDALAWGLVPLYLAAHDQSATRIAVVAAVYPAVWGALRSEEHTSELQSRGHLVCRLLLEKKKNRQELL